MASDSAVMVRPADPEDAEAVAALTTAVQALHAAARPEVFRPADSATFPATRVRELLADPDRLFFVAAEGGRVVGHAYAEVQRQPATPFKHPVARLYVHQMAVAAECRGRGVGTLLLAAVREAARARGLGAVALDVWAFNGAARRFYERAGFGPERVYLTQPLAAGPAGGSAGAP